MVFLDEFQWLAAERNDLISELKFVWDNYFAKNNNVHLILCGSISSFIVKRVARSKAFYGRIDLQIHLKPLNLKEVQGGFFNNSTQREVVEHWMILGGVPWYLNLCDPSRTPEQNAKVLLFSNLGKLFRETEQLFVSHFGKNPAYQKVVEYLGVHRFSHRKPLVKAGGMKSGGGASDILEDLELAGFIESYSSIHLADSKRLVRYRLADPFLRFYYHFVAPLRKRIEREGEVCLLYTSPSPRDPL